MMFFICGPNYRTAITTKPWHVPILWVLIPLLPYCTKYEHSAFGTPTLNGRLWKGSRAFGFVQPR